MIKSTDFRPEHFRNGQSFDPQDFEDYIKASDKLSKAMFTRYIPCIFAGLALSYLVSAGGGASGHLLALVCIFGGLLLAPLTVSGINKEIKALTSRMGITRQDVAEARKHIKNGTVAWRAENKTEEK